MTITEAKKVVRAKYPKAAIFPHRCGDSGSWKYTVYKEGFYRSAGDRLSGDHRTSDAAWIKAAYNVQRKLA